jgi:hypothetical protein
VFTPELHEIAGKDTVMEEPAARPGMVARMRAIAGQVRDFADAEAAASGLPGLDQGPADAYRHLVGVAELSRRVGPIAAAGMAEWNEWLSVEAMFGSLLDGRPVARSNTPAARRMDRHNNRIALGVGATARSTEEVVLRARAMMERAIQTYGGTGFANTPRWQPSRAWSEGGPLTAWPPGQWPNLDDTDHLRIYRERIASDSTPERESTATGGVVHVRPHQRDGHPVSGHTRAAPAR